MRKITAIALLLISALLNAASPAAAQVELLPDLPDDLRLAVCLRDWDDAIDLTEQIIGSEATSSEQRQQLIEFRHQLENNRAINFASNAIPGCEGVEAAEEPFSVPRVISPERLEQAATAVVGMYPYWSGWVANRGLYDYERRPAIDYFFNDDGRCERPEDIAADGRRCGNRATILPSGQ